MHSIISKKIGEQLIIDCIYGLPETRTITIASKPLVVHVFRIQVGVFTDMLILRDLISIKI
jgi:hypothetical protein